MISLKNINKIYNENKKQKYTSLKNINLEIKEQEFIILKGISGSGKTTLLSIIGGLNKPSNGEVKILNEYISKLPDFHISKFRLEKIGFIFQSFNLFENLSVSENISLALTPMLYSNQKIEKMVSEVMKKVSIFHKKDNLTKELSGGERQRVAIARALVNRPKIILADEPTANLDKKNSLIFIEILEKLKDEGHTILVATHDNIFFNLKKVDRIIELKDGKIIC